MILPPELITDSEEATRQFAAEVAQACRGGEIILLEGPLGAGKTCFAGGFAEGLEIAGPIPSPTFVLLRSYRGTRGLTLHHFDFYRLNERATAGELGFEDCAAPDAVVLAEWAERCPSIFPDFTLRIKLAHGDKEDERVMQIERGSLPLPPDVHFSSTM